jgi:hypothetical protein
MQLKHHSNTGQIKHISLSIGFIAYNSSILIGLFHISAWDCRKTSNPGLKTKGPCVASSPATAGLVALCAKAYLVLHVLSISWEKGGVHFLHTHLHVPMLLNRYLHVPIYTSLRDSPDNLDLSK